MGRRTSLAVPVFATGMRSQTVRSRPRCFIPAGVTLVMATVGLLLVQPPIVDAGSGTPGTSGAISPRLWTAMEKIRFRIEPDTQAAGSSAYLDDADAVDPGAADPLLTRETKLRAPDAAVGDEFGNSVAIDGHTAVVGAVDKVCAAGIGCGAAYVFVRSGTTWTQQQALAAVDAAAGDAFGGSVAVSARTIVVAAPDKACAAGDKCGAVYVFVWSGTTWIQQQELTAPDAAPGDEFGKSVAVSGDTIVAGASPKACAAGIGCGAAYVFLRSGTEWSLQQVLTASQPAAFDQFGHSVAVSEDTAVIGVPHKACAAGIACGALYVFARRQTTWSERQILTATDAAAFDLLGTAVDVDGDTAVGGAPLKACAAGAGCGAAYVFARRGTTWSQQQALAASDAAAGDNLGIAVAVSEDAAVAGTALKACFAGLRCGAAYAFARSGTTWSQQQKFTASDAAANDFFGAAVALSRGTALIGALDKACTAGVGCGAAYMYAVRATRTEK